MSLKDFIKKKIRFQFENIWIIGIIGIGIFFSAFAISQKENYHVDELYSFFLSNNLGSTSINFEEGISYNISDSPWLTGMSAEGKARFNIENVWMNQKNDVHPPLYYILLNFICSFFPGKISIWFPGVINLFFYAIAAFFIYKLSHCLLPDRFTNYIVLGYAVFCYGMLQMNSFFRMYIVAMAWVVMMTYLNINAVIKRKFGVTYYFTVAMVVFGGALTHYYVIIFAVFQSIAMVIILWHMEMFKELFSYASSVILAGIHTVLLFPYMIYHIFTGGSRGKEAFSNFGKEGIKRFFDFGNIVNEELFGGLLILVFVYIFITFMFAKMKSKSIQKKTTKEKNMSGYSWFVVIFSVVLYFLVVSKSAAYITDRYIYPVYGLTVVIVISGICYGTQKLFCKHMIQKGVVLISVCILLFMGYRGAKWEYLYHNEISRTALANAEKYQNYNCFYVYKAKWTCQLSFLEALQYANITFYSIERLPEIRNVTAPTVIYVPKENSEEYMNQITKQNPWITEYEIISEFSGYETGYVVK